MTSHRGWSFAVDVPPDQPTAIGQILGRLAEANVTVEGNAKAGAALRVLTSDRDATRAVLRRWGFEPLESEVLVVTVGREPGVVSRVLQDIANAGLSIEFMYLASKSRIVIGADCLEAIAAVIQRTEPS